MAETIAEKNVILNLITKSDGANKALGDLDRVQSKSNGLKSAIGGLGKSFAVAFAAFKAGEVINQMSDLAVQIDKVSGNSKGLEKQQNKIQDSIRRVAVLASQTLIPLLDQVFRFVEPIIKAFAIEIPAAIQAALPTLQTFVTKGLGLLARGLGVVTGNSALIGFAAAADALAKEAEEEGKNFSERYAANVAANKKAWEEAGKTVGKIFGEGLSKEQQKAIEKLKKDILKAARNIEDLRALAVSDLAVRRIRQLQTRAKQQIEALVGTPEQVIQQTDLINQILQRELTTVLQGAFLKLKTDLKKNPLGKILQESLLEFSDEELELLPDFDPEDKAFKDARKNLDKLFNNTKEQADKLTLFDKIEQFIDKAQLEESGEIILESFKALSDDILQLNIDRVEDDIKIQESRIQRLQELESGATEEQLRLENERLTELEEKRRQFAERQRGIAAIQIAANSAVAVSEGISAVIAGFKEGSLFKGIAQAIALAGTIASTVFAVKQAVSSIPAFRTGETDFQPNNLFSDGDPDSGLARLHRGEGVSPSPINQKLNKLGVPVTDPYLPKLVATALNFSNTPNYVPFIPKTQIESKDIKELGQYLGSKIDGMRKAYEMERTHVNIDDKGIYIATQKVKRRNQRKNKKLK